MATGLVYWAGRQATVFVMAGCFPPLSPSPSPSSHQEISRSSTLHCQTIVVRLWFVFAPGNVRERQTASYGTRATADPRFYSKRLKFQASPFQSAGPAGPASLATTYLDKLGTLYLPMQDPAQQVTSTSSTRSLSRWSFGLSFYCCFVA